MTDQKRKTLQNKILLEVQKQTGPNLRQTEERHDPQTGLIVREFTDDHGIRYVFVDEGTPPDRITDAEPEPPQDDPPRKSHLQLQLESGSVPLRTLLAWNERTLFGVQDPLPRGSHARMITGVSSNGRPIITDTWNGQRLYGYDPGDSSGNANVWLDEHGTPVTINLHGEVVPVNAQHNSWHHAPWNQHPPTYQATVNTCLQTFGASASVQSPITPEHRAAMIAIARDMGMSPEHIGELFKE